MLLELGCVVVLRSKVVLLVESISIERQAPERSKIESFQSFEEAFHQLMLELLELQVQSAKLALGETPVKRIYMSSPRGLLWP